jgi:hypothetical protein
VAKAAGVILTDAYGRVLDATFDTSTPIHWCGYANENLRRQIAPIICDWLASRMGDTAG